MAAVDYFLKIDGIKGESKDAKHKDEIQLLSYSFGDSQPATMAFGGGGGAGKVQMTDFIFTMTVNRASPPLWLACATGAHIKSVVFTARKAGKDQQEYVKIVLEEVMVSNYQSNGAAEADGLPVDSVSLNYARLVFHYHIQDEKGMVKPGARAGYNLKEMEAL
jgi:type VI secretion system secreted protein Hcp